jgi:hypothetical protein
VGKNDSPLRVTYAIWLLYTALAMLGVRAAIGIAGASGPIKVEPLFLVSVAVLFGAQIVLILMIQQGRSWARFVLAGVALCTVPGSVVYLLGIQKPPSFYHEAFGPGIVVDIASVTLKFAGLAMLFGGSASTWFACAQRQRADAPTPGTLSSASERRSSRVMFTVSSVMFAVSLALPVFTFKERGAVFGLTVLEWGWWGILLGEAGWLANLAFLYALWAFSKRRGFASRVASSAAFMIGLTSFHAKEWYFNEGGGTQIHLHGPGFYLWLFSLFVLMLGSWLLPARDKGFPGEPAGVS